MSVRRLVEAALEKEYCEFDIPENSKINKVEDTTKESSSLPKPAKISLKSALKASGKEPKYKETNNFVKPEVKREEEIPSIGGKFRKEELEEEEVDENDFLKTHFSKEGLQEALDEKKAKLGSGERFRTLVKQLAAKESLDEALALAEYTVTNPKALAAWIGRRKYGKDKFQKMAAKGRKKHAK